MPAPTTAAPAVRTNDPRQRIDMDRVRAQPDVTSAFRDWIKQAGNKHMLDARGFAANHEIYIMFNPQAEGVVLSKSKTDADAMLAKYPLNMTIVLQMQVGNLRADPAAFRVQLKFGGRPHDMVIPYDAISCIYDAKTRDEIKFYILSDEEFAEEQTALKAKPAPQQQPAAQKARPRRS
ncbi:MAG: ClpXP protease specificity-enhancing factor SspB [Bdellovibrionales bacterium]